MSHTNKEAVFEALWKQMEMLAKSGDKAEGDESRRIAHLLISYAELPILYRIRAHMTLACGKDSYVWHAEEAVRLATKSIEMTGSGTDEGEEVSEQQAKTEKEAEQALLECAQETLRDALRDHAELETVREAYRKSGSTGKWVVKYGGGVTPVVKKTHSKPVPTGSVSMPVEELPDAQSVDTDSAHVNRASVDNPIHSGDSADAVTTTQDGDSIDSTAHTQTDTTHDRLGNGTFSISRASVSKASEPYTSGLNGASEPYTFGLNGASQTNTSQSDTHGLNGASQPYTFGLNGASQPYTLGLNGSSSASHANGLNGTSSASHAHGLNGTSQPDTSGLKNGASQPYADGLNGAFEPDTSGLNGATTDYEDGRVGAASDETPTATSRASASDAPDSDTANVDGAAALIGLYLGGPVGGTGVANGALTTNSESNRLRRSSRIRKQTKTYGPATR